MLLGKQSLRSHQPEKRIYQSRYPHHRNFTRYAVSPAPPQMQRFEKGKTDILMENYLLYGETLEQGAHRILQEILPSAPPQNLHFCFMYHFENEITNRLVYNFIA